MSSSKKATKSCPCCCRIKPVEAFSKREGLRCREYCSYCKSCRTAKESLRAQLPEVRQRRNILQRLRHTNARLQAIILLGGCCQLCGCKENRFLVIDHRNGGGFEHRRRRANYGVYNDVIEDGNRLVWSRVLCLQCNAALPLFKRDEHALKAAVRREHQRIRSTASTHLTSRADDCNLAHVPGSCLERSL